MFGQLSQALSAFFQQMQAAFQNFANSFNSFFTSFNSIVNSVAQAIANIFNPGGALAAAVPAAVQEDIAGAASFAAMSLDEGAPKDGFDTAKLDIASSDSTDFVETEDVVTDTVSVEETTETEGTETEESEVNVQDKDAMITNDDTIVTDPPGANAESGMGNGNASAVTETESREPVRTGLVARPGEVGDDPDDSGGAPNTDDVTKPNETDPQSGEAESGEAGEAA